MARFLSQTLNLIRTTAAKTRGIRRLSAQPESPLTAEPTISEAEAKAWAWDVEALEDSIYRKIVISWKPDWLPFVPGASYWVPPRTSCGASEVARSLAYNVSIEENLSPAMIRVLFASTMEEYCGDHWADIPFFKLHEDEGYTVCTPFFFLPDSTSHVGYKTFCVVDFEDADFRFAEDDDNFYFENVPDHIYE